LQQRGTEIRRYADRCGIFTGPHQHLALPVEIASASSCVEFHAPDFRDYSLTLRDKLQ
jgi:hypothetical protein